MKIAIASSGLGHVARGIETWALDTAMALSERGVDTTLFAAGPLQVSNVECRASNDKGSVEYESPDTERRPRNLESGTQNSEPGTKNREQALRLPRIWILPCLKRSDASATRRARLALGCAWRWGLKNPYGWEQLSFWWRLWPILRREHFDIMHVQDPMLAYWCRKFRKTGLIGTIEILAHGTEEPNKFLRQFDYVQHLAPWHLSQAELGLKAEGRDLKPEIGTWKGAEAGSLKSERGKTEEIEHQGREESKDEDESSLSLRVSVQNDFAGGSFDTQVSGSRFHPSGPKPFWTAIPNFADVNVFAPAHDGAEKAKCRERFGIPEDAFVIGCVAAVKKHHKRIDYLIREFASSATSARRHLVIAGARCDDSDGLVELAEELAPGRITILMDLPRADMSALYRAMDVFVLPSLFEMMPIAILEAMASGVPVIANKHPVLEWMIGDGGACIDLAREGALGARLSEMTPEWLSQHAASARTRAAAVFSKPVVIEQYIEYYRKIVMNTGTGHGA